MFIYLRRAPRGHFLTAFGGSGHAPQTWPGADRALRLRYVRGLLLRVGLEWSMRFRCGLAGR